MQVQLLNKSQVISRLHSIGLVDLKDNFVKNLLDTGQIPFVRVGRNRRVRSDVLDSYINNLLNSAL